MRKKDDRRTRLGAREARWTEVYTLIFLAAAALVFWTFRQEGRSFLYYYAGQERDGFTQHYTAFAYIGRYVREWCAGLFQGQFALKQFDFTLGYGEDVIQSLAYYGFGDPLMLLSALVPQKLAAGFYQVYILLELWLAGLSFAWFGREKGFEGRWLLPASLVYVFSGFALWAGLCHPEFLAPMLYFPLMLVGIERSLKGRRPVFLAVTTALYALTGYYWLFMGTIFTCLYALVRFWEESRGERAGMRLKELWRFFLRSAGGYLLGIMAAGAFFLPNVIGFLQSNRVGGDRGMPPLFLTGTERHLYFLHLLSVDSWNFVALAAIVLPALLLLMTRRERTCRGMQGMALLLTAFYLMPVFGYLFNAGAYASARWNVFLDFFAAYFVLMMLPRLVSPGWQGPAACIAAAALYGWAAWAAPGSRRMYGYALGALGVTLVLVLLLSLLGRRWKGPGRERLACLALTVLIAGNAAMNGYLTFSSAGSGYSEMFAETGLVEEEVASMPARAVLDLEREEWQRVDQDYEKNANASMILDYAGVASYFSTSNGNTARFLSEMELPLHNKVLFPDLDSRTFLGALLSVRYQAGAAQGGRSVPYGFEPVKTEGENVVWEDPGVLPLGYTYDTIVSEEDWESLNALEKQAVMMQAVRGDGPDAADFRTADGDMTAGLVRAEILDVTGDRAEWTDGEINAWEDGATLTITFRGLPDSETCLRLKNVRLAWTDASQYHVAVQAGDMERECVFTSANFLWHSSQPSTTINLGYSAQGLTQVTLTFRQAGGFKLDDLELWCQSMAEYDVWRDELSRESLTDVQVGTNRITGSIRTSGARVLCFSIPYSPGWTVYIDGEKTQTLRANDFLLAAAVGEGTHRVELRYRSPGFAAGALLSAAGLAGIGLMLFRGRRSGPPDTEEETDG